MKVAVYRPQVFLDAMLTELRVVYALFRAVRSYTGAAGQMIHAVGGATEDLLFLPNGKVDPVQITTFAAGGTVAFLPYDQSGQGLHATQATASKRPLLCVAGVVSRNADGEVAASFVGVDRSHWLIPDAFPVGTTTALVLVAGEMGANGAAQVVARYRGPVVALGILLNEFGNAGRTQLHEASVDIEANQTFEITYPQSLAAHYSTGGAAYLLVGGVDHGTDPSCTFDPSGTANSIGKDGTDTINGTIRLVCLSRDPDRTKLLLVARWLRDKAGTAEYDPASFGPVTISDVNPFVVEENSANWMSFSHPIDSWAAGSGTRYQVVGYWNAALTFTIARRSRPSGGAWTAFTTSVLSGVTNAGINYHDAPRLGIDGNGVLWIFDTVHGGSQHAWRSNAALSTWNGSTVTEVTAIGSPSSIENAVGYATTFRLADGNLAVMWRDGTAGDGDTYLWVHTAASDTWAAASGLNAQGFLFSGAADDLNAYHHQKPVVDVAGWVHFVGFIREDALGNAERDLFHVRWQPTTGTWQTAAGTTQSVPITDANKATVKTFTGLVNVGPGAMVTDAARNCLYVFSASDDADGLRVLQIATTGTVTEHLLPYAITQGRRAAFLNDGRLYVVASLADKGQGIRLFRSAAGNYATWQATTLTRDFTGNATPMLDQSLYAATGEAQVVTPLRPLDSSVDANGFPAHLLAVLPGTYGYM